MANKKKSKSEKPITELRGGAVVKSGILGNNNTGSLSGLVIKKNGVIYMR
jgi:hypothetical protein